MWECPEVCLLATIVIARGFTDAKNQFRKPDWMPVGPDGPLGPHGPMGFYGPYKPMGQEVN